MKDYKEKYSQTHTNSNTHENTVEYRVRQNSVCTVCSLKSYCWTVVACAVRMISFIKSGTHSLSFDAIETQILEKKIFAKKLKNQKAIAFCVFWAEKLFV